MATEAVIERDWELVASLAADLHDAHARLVELVAEALAEGSWQAPGLRSPEHWLMLRAGLSRGQAGSIVLLARRRDELPATAAALRQGRISLDQAAVVARHTPAAFDRTVAEFARHATVTQLQRTVPRYDFTLEPASHDAEGDLLPAAKAPGARPAPVEPASLSMHHDEHGRFRLRYDAPAEVGALVEAALAEAKDHLFRTLSGSTDPEDAPETGDTPDTPGTPDTAHPGGDTGGDPGGDTSGEAGRPRVTWADAFTLMATRSLQGAASKGRRARYRVNVHLDTDGGWLTGRPRLPRHIVDGLTCDGALTPVWTTRGRPVSVGRADRTVPDRTRRLIRDRDRGCRFPGCGTSAHVEVHHLVHWRDGGPTDVDNLASLCPFHHDGHHRGEFTITGDPTRPDGLEFLTLHGLLIGPPRRPPTPPAPVDTEPKLDTGPPDIADAHIRTRRDSGPKLDTGPPDDGQARDTRARTNPPAARPRPRLGRHYPAPTGGTLHLHLVDFTPSRPRPPRP